MKNRHQGYIKAFGLNIKKIRIEKNITQEQLAYLADVEANQIYRLEKGHHAATLHTVVAVASALGKQPKELHEFYYKLTLNKNFDFPTSKRGENQTTELVRMLVEEENFFNDCYHTTGDVIKHYKKKNKILKSSDVSGILRNLFHDKTLERIPGEKKGTYKYTKAKKKTQKES